MMFSMFRTEFLRRSADGRNGIDRSVEGKHDGLRLVAEVRGIAAGAAVKRVGAKTTAKRVGSGIAAERIVSRTPDDVFDLGDRVLGKAADCHCDGIAAIQRHDDGSLLVAVVRRIAVLAAVQYVGTAAAHEPVVAARTRELVGGGIAGKRIACRSTYDVLDVADRILRNAADEDCSSIRTIELHEDGGCLFAQVEGVDPVAAIDGIVALATEQGIGANAAIENVVSYLTAKNVVPIIAR